MTTKITVLGAGGMGTACAVLLAHQPETLVSLWTSRDEYAEQMRETRENRRLLPGVQIPSEVEITADFQEASESTDGLLIAIPAQFLRKAISSVAPYLDRKCFTVSVVKGIENQSLLRPSEIVREILGDMPVVSLSGPSHAEEIARNLPATLVAASRDSLLAKQVQRLFSNNRFRVYTNEDIVGVEIAGALKNIIAIAAGACDGLGFGDNAKSSLLTRGLVEMIRFGTAFGAKRSTFYGLAGVGDLVTTCQSPYGRNRRVGEALGKGECLESITRKMNGVAEGVATTKSIRGLADSHGIDMPITTEIYRVLFEGKSPLQAVGDLMSRPFKAEGD
ncbi:MAG: NAD(P)-dependent glycerol-3-phosphate dehydrogenase [Planctomycetes bacterium]|nr:NAD(P)-dependent glycerol-3-phosphate dehydrogenase [Planctomycetota bacterium]